MTGVCPSCGGNLVGCPICNAPPKRIAQKMMYVVPPPLKGRLRSLIMRSPTWEVQGVDLSKWNGNVNFAITRTKCQYAFLRYGYGDGWEDPKLATYYNDAKLNDFPVGAYWFCYIGKDPQKHAQGFADLLRKYPPTLEEVDDAETSSCSTPQQSLEWMKNMDSRLKGLTNKDPMTYTSPGIWNGMIASSIYWKLKLLWDAAWTTADAPRIPYDFTDWLYWQWDADGNRKAAEYGSTGGDYDMDLNRCKLTIAQFNARYGTHIQPIGATPQPPSNVVPEKVLIAQASVNIRSAPNPVGDTYIIGGTTLNKVWYPETIEKDQSLQDWYKMGKKVYIKKELTKLP
jgi:GH25 family lysozyme M1 (1,4-beta-N-acetylmuramidase)